MTLETNWYVYQGGKRGGPYTWQQVYEMSRTRQMQPADRLWHAQYPNMVGADQVENLNRKIAFGEGQPAENLREIPAEMVTTAFELPGYRIKKSLGVVQAFVVPALNYGTSFAVAFSGIKGATTGPYQQAISEAYRQLMQASAQAGANALVGFRLDGSQAGFMAYGTAVVVEEV